MLEQRQIELLGDAAAPRCSDPFANGDRLAYRKKRLMIRCRDYDDTPLNYVR
jgi:hypothetical protein